MSPRKDAMFTLTLATILLSATLATAQSGPQFGDPGGGPQYGDLPQFGDSPSKTDKKSRTAEVPAKGGLYIQSVNGSTITAGPGYSGMGMGGGFGTITDPTKPITPATKIDELWSGTYKTQQDLQAQYEAQESAVDQIRFHMKDHAVHIHELRRSLIAAQKAKTPTMKIEADIAAAESDFTTFSNGLKEARTRLGETRIKLAEAEKAVEKEQSKNQGWVLADSKEEKELAAKENFSCASGDRMVKTGIPGFGLYTWACLNSKGFMMKQGTRNIGMPQFDADTVYMRDGDTLTGSSTKIGGKLFSEQSIGPKEATYKMYDGGDIRSSCTYYGDEKTRNSGWGIGGSGMYPGSGTSKSGTTR